MAISKIKTGSITDSAVNTDKLAPGSVGSTDLSATVISGQTELSETANDADFTIIFDTSSSTLKKVLRSNLKQSGPTVSSVSPTNAVEGDGTATFTITGTGFTAGSSARLIGNLGKIQEFDTVTRSNATTITSTVAFSSLEQAQEPYDVQVTNGEGISSLLANQINIDASPVFVTAAGSLGSDRFDMSSASVNATDPDSAGNVTFELQSGSLPPGISITNTGANGGTATFTGTFSSLASSDTVHNFTLRAVDAASNTTSRAFSFTRAGPISQSFTSSGTFSVPTGVTSADVLVVAGGGSGGSHHGGGGGGGGLVFMPSVPLSPGGTVAITVGCGGPVPANFPGTPSGAPGSTGQDSVFGASPSPGTTNPLTAKGGGSGGYNDSGAGGQGGSGGGGSAITNALRGQGIQPTQPGNSGAYGFGNDGGDGVIDGPKYLGGGGGGAGAAGNPGLSPSSEGGPGAVGRAYTIADGTTPVYYAGGGGGGAHIHNAGSASPCGTGGKGSYENATFPIADKSGQANKGGGGGGADRGTAAGGTGGSGGGGGKGVVIVRY
jgi:hypothetical protein